MNFEPENPRVRLAALVAVWLGLTFLAFSHARLIREYLVMVGELGLRGSAAPDTPLGQPVPAFAADAQTWIRHALTLSEGEQSRLRFTSIDNAPFGREVHWNSAWGWLIAWGGKLEHWANNTPLPRATERMAIWINPFVLSVLMIIISFWTAKRAGLFAGIIIAAGMLGHPRIYEGFFPAYVDHHGVLTVSVLGMFLGALFMGAGWWTKDGLGGGFLPASPDLARRGAVASAISGALGMWVSAASVLPPIAVVGSAGLVSVILFGRRALVRGEAFDPECWRLWGRVGGGLSFAFYLLEYFPNHLGLRMEANHPFYSLAWWGAGEIIARIASLWLDGGKINRRFLDRRFLVPLAAVALAPATILIGGSRVFVVADPFLSDLHKFYIQEFLPLWVPLKGVGWQSLLGILVLENLPFLTGLVLAIVAWKRLPVAVLFAVIAIAVVTSMAWIQSRWLLNSSACQIGLGVLLASMGFRRLPPRWGWLVGLPLAAALLLPQPFERISAAKNDLAARRVSPKDANSALSRDVARVIRASQPQGEVVLLTSPNSSTAVGYFGRFKTLGTLYWENNDGLKAAGAILSASSDEEAAQLIRKHKVTHIAMISEENFVEPYFRLLKGGNDLEGFKKSFGYKILFARVIPAWLQMIPYKVPDDLAALNVSALLFKVAFDQTPADALYHIALTKIALGSPAEAERDFETLIKGSPESFQPYVRKAELQLGRNDHLGAAEMVAKAIALAPLEEALELANSFGGILFRAKQHRAAQGIYEAFLARAFNPPVAAYLAFVLACSSDDTVRDPVRALEWAEKAVTAEVNSPTTLNTLAVALAANGRFPEAVAAAERALVVARAANQPQAAKVSETRLQAFRAGRAWRE